VWIFLTLRFCGGARRIYGFVWSLRKYCESLGVGGWVGGLQSAFGIICKFFIS
jgi:hypothetical protein